MVDGVGKWRGGGEGRKGTSGKSSGVTYLREAVDVVQPLKDMVSVLVGLYY